MNNKMNKIIKVNLEYCDAARKMCLADLRVWPAFGFEFHKFHSYHHGFIEYYT
jgi:hypothetical protein